MASYKTETQMYRAFCREPLGNKLISEVPGVGPIASRRFRRINYTKAAHLYDKLRRLNFSEKEFRVWMKENCKRVKVSAIYSSLLLWHIQYGVQADPDDSNTVDASQDREPPADRPDRTPRPDHTTTVRPCGRCNQDMNSCLNASRNPLMTLFLATFADSFKKISSDYHTELKMEILGVLCKYERRMRDRQRVSFAASSTPRSADA